MTAVHDRSAMGDFFSKGDNAQVWAIDRHTGEPHYLAVGQAAAVREVAKRSWRCPYPGCVVEISTRGTARTQDHFWHPSGTPHPSDGESEAHLGAKAMLRLWASQRCPDGAAVEEETVFLEAPGAAALRRADVMVTWATGAKTAFEVEYKNYSPEDWAQKQDDYNQQRITCVWLLGHTRVRHRETLTEADGAEVAFVRVSPLAQAWAQQGRHVLVVNPVTRQIGTMAADRRFTSRPNPHSDTAWLRVDSLDECVLHPTDGLVTPAMRLIAAAEEKQRRQEEARREAEARRAQSRLKADSAATYSNDQRREYAIRKQQEAAQRWATSPFRDRCINRWRGIPSFLTQELPGDRGVWADPEHWHCVVFYSLLDVKQVGATFTVRDVYSTLLRNGVVLHTSSGKRRAEAVVGFLNHLADHGYVAFQRSGDTVIHGEITVRGNMKAKPATRIPHTTAQPITPPRQATPPKRPLFAGMPGSPETRWAESVIRQRIFSEFGELPGTLVAGAGRADTAFRTLPVEWHAHIALALVHNKPPGSKFSVHDVATVLAARSIPFNPNDPRVPSAIKGYLDYLSQQGLLRMSQSGDYVTTGQAIA